MKKTIITWLNFLLIAGVIMILATSCNKRDITNETIEPAPSGTVTDIEGNVYNTLTIGTQVWMIENLKTTKYRNGNPIPNVTSYDEWFHLRTGAYCNYNNDVAIGAKYGKLFNWYAVNDSRNIAPVGWHVPSDEELTTLENYVDYHLGNSISVAKAHAAKTDWHSSPSDGAIGNDLTNNNSSGFSALPGGYRTDYGVSFYSVGSDGYWWSSTEYKEDKHRAWIRIMGCSRKDIMRTTHDKLYGFSVRCIKD